MWWDSLHSAHPTSEDDSIRKRNEQPYKESTLDMAPLSRRTFLQGSFTAAIAGAGGAANTGFAATPEENQKEVTFQRRIPIRHEVDVFVAGGGPSGVAAAVSAARQKKSVFLAERHTCLGGMGSAARVPSLAQLSDGAHFLAGGVGEDIFNRLQKSGGVASEQIRLTGFTPIHAEVLKRVYDALLREAGVDFTFQTSLIGVEADSGCVSLAILAAKSGLFAVKAKMFVDCTGDADLAAWAGAPFEKGDNQGNLMPGTLCSLWADIDWSRVKQRAGQKLEEAFHDEVFTHEDRHLPGMFRLPGSLGGGNLGHTYGVDGTDERSVTEALLEGRRQMVEYQRYYKEYLQDGYEAMNLAATGSLLGIRESRRILGDYVLNVEDFKRRAVFEDEIGRYCYPVDIHPSRPDPIDYAKFREEYERTLRYEKGESYGIPYRVLVPRKLSNVLVAGRCVSSDRYIQGSIRVMPGCYITGQAAGAAAAIAVEHNTDTRGFPVAELQHRLKGMGAYLPNSPSLSDVSRHENKS